MNHKVSVASQSVGSGVAFEPEAACTPPHAGLHGAFASEGLYHRDPELLSKAGQHLLSLGVDDATTGYNERTSGQDKKPHYGRNLRRAGLCASDRPDLGVKKACRKVERLGLDILGQREYHSASLHRASEHSHRFWKRGQQLLRSGDAVEKPRYRPEAVVDADVSGAGMLQLLEYRPLTTGCIGITWQQQHGQPVHGRQRCSSHHIRRAGPDRRRHGQRRPAAMALSICRRHMYQSLLVATLHIRQTVSVLVERLADTGNVTVTEYPQHPRHKSLLTSVAATVLSAEIAHKSLCRSQADRRASEHLHHVAPCRITVLASVISSTAHRGPSLPIPLPLIPP